MKKILFILTAIIMCTHVSAQDGRISSQGYAVFSKDGGFQPYEFTRHAVGEHDILIRTLYCGICHSDIHQARSDWREETYPIVPGHEIVGEVVQVGSGVTRFKVGDIAGVGCMVNACRHCEYCENDQEQYCMEGRVLTYSDKDLYHDNEITRGGYSTNMVVDESFAIRVPKDAPLEKVGPLMCAGITTWSPIMQCGIKAGQYLVSLGAEVTVFDITEEKRADALRLGAKRYVNVTREEEMQGLDNTLRFILSTIPASYDPMMYINILKVGGTLAVVGMPAVKDAPQINITALQNRYLTTSIIGGIKETQEVVDYSVAHGIYPETVVIPADASAIDKAYRDVVDGKVKFRYVIDLKTIKTEKQ